MRMNNEWVDISDPEVPRCEAQPAFAAVLTHADPGDVGGPAVGGRHDEVDFPWIGGGRKEPVRVRIQAGDWLPAPPTVVALQETAHFNGSIYRVGPSLIKSEALDVRLARRPRK